jgi:PilZ domain-containing protein
MTSFDFEREHYRIMYPTAARPRFSTSMLEREVIDLCEMGMRYRAADGESRRIGDEVEGVVRVRRGAELGVLGTVVRIEGDEIAMRLRLGIPLRVVLDEQRYIREHHRSSVR